MSEINDNSSWLQVQPRETLYSNFSLSDQTHLQLLKNQNDFLEQDLLYKLSLRKNEGQNLIINLISKLKQCDKALQVLEDKAFSYQASLQVRQDELNQVQERLKESENKLHYFEVENQELKNLQIKFLEQKTLEIDKLRSENAKLKSKSNLSDHIHRDSIQRNSENKRLFAKNQALEEELTSVRGKNLILFNEITTNNMIKSKENLKIKAENDQLMLRIQSLQMQLSQLSISPIKTIKTEEIVEKTPEKSKDNTDKDLLAIKSQNKFLQTTLSTKENEISKISRLNKSISKARLSKEEELQAIKQENTILKNEIDALQNQILKLESKNSILVTNLNLKEKEIFQVLDVYQKELFEKAQEIDNCRKKLAETQTSNRDNIFHRKGSLEACENNNYSLSYISCDGSFDERLTH